MGDLLDRVEIFNESVAITGDLIIRLDLYKNLSARKLSELFKTHGSFVRPRKALCM